METKKGTDKLSDPAAYDHVHCDQFGIDHDGNPIADYMTGTGSDAGPKEFDPDKPHKMTLTQEEQDVLNGSQGPVMAKVLKTIVMHGELFGAERLADCGGAPHTSLYTGSPWVVPVLEMFEEIADAGLKAFAPYTVNPMPLDLYTVGRDPVKRMMELDSYSQQSRLIQVHTRLGAVPLNNWSCACYLPEVGNTAEPGTVVTWAESSAVNYGNSVLGLRINRMATGMEILCGIAGKVPVFGVLTDEGRKAKWHIDVQALRGAALGRPGRGHRHEDGRADSLHHRHRPVDRHGGRQTRPGLRGQAEGHGLRHRLERRCRAVSRGERHARSDRAGT